MGMAIIKSIKLYPDGRKEIWLAETDRPQEEFTMRWCSDTKRSKITFIIFELVDFDPKDPMGYLEKLLSKTKEEIAVAHESSREGTEGATTILPGLNELETLWSPVLERFFSDREYLY